MKNIFLILVLLSTAVQSFAQQNVAEIAHTLFKAIKTNDFKAIDGRFLDINAAYAILPKESAGMSLKRKNNTYLVPMHKEFIEDFEKIQTLIKKENIAVERIDLVSYKLEKKKQDEVKPIAMSLFFTYNKKEHILPITVVEIEEKWYITKILQTEKLFD
jgi:hypothetical protein